LYPEGEQVNCLSRFPTVGIDRRDRRQIAGSNIAVSAVGELSIFKINLCNAFARFGKVEIGPNHELCDPQHLPGLFVFEP